MSFDWVGRLFTASMTVSSSILFFARCTCSSVMCSSPWRSASSALTRSRSTARRAAPRSWAAGLRQTVIDLQELVQDVVAVLLHELVDFVEGDDHDALLLVEFLQEQAVHAVRRQAGERDPLMEVLDELVADRLEHAVRGVDDLAVKVEVLVHLPADRLPELV